MHGTSCPSAYTSSATHPLLAWGSTAVRVSIRPSQLLLAVRNDSAFAREDSALAAVVHTAHALALKWAQADEIEEGDLFGADVAEQDGEDSRGESDGEHVSEDELMESGDEEETQLLGGAGFSPGQLAAAAAHFEKEMVRTQPQCPSEPGRLPSGGQTRNCPQKFSKNK